MFNNQRSGGTKQPLKRPDPTKDTAVTILTSGCHFSGKLYCRGSSRIGGKIEGEIISEGLLIIEEEAIINANIRADEAIIQGRVHGRIEARARVELCSSSSFNGDIATPILIVKEGAQFNGNSAMTHPDSLDERVAPPAEAGTRPPNVKHSDSLHQAAKVETPDVGMIRVTEIRAN